METNTDERTISPLAQLRAKLGQKAKLESNFRFYTLYHHISRPDVLLQAWTGVKENGGAPGIDGISIKDIEKQGVMEFLEGIQGDLQAKTYYPKPVKRVYIPKSDGKLRPLGLPTVRDRVVQAALMLIIEPIFEQDFLNCSYGFRPGRSAHQAIGAIRKEVQQGRLQVYDADLKGYFDSIPHDKLMKAVERRIADTQVLKLIRKWLKAPIWEAGKPMKANDQGTPQGGVISPLLANIYLHWFDKIFHDPEGPGTWAKAKIVRYADDFVIMARYMTDRITTWIESKLEGRFGLQINREKTKILNLENPKTNLNFLGFSLRWTTLRGTERKFCLIVPSEKSLIGARETIRRHTSPKNGYKPIEAVVRGLNLFVRGWSNYFEKGNSSKAFGKLNVYMDNRISNFLQRRSQRGYKKKDKKNSWYKEFRDLGFMQFKKTAVRAKAHGNAL